MLSDTLYEIQDSLHYQTSEIKNLDDLILALNDWPEVPKNFEEYLKQLNNFLSVRVITIDSIKNAQARKHPSVNQLWEAESLASLYRFMYMNSSKNLEDLFAELKNYIPSNL